MHSRERELTDVVMSVARLIRRRQVAALEPFGLSPSQSRALRVLTRVGEPVRLGFLAERLRIVPRSATDVVDSLEEAGWVRRTPDPNDRRAVLLELTDAGATPRCRRRESSTTRILGCVRRPRRVGASNSHRTSRAGGRGARLSAPRLPETFGVSPHAATVSTASSTFSADVGLL